MLVLGFMKNVEIEKEIDLLHNVCCVTGPMNPLLRALQRIVKAHINKEFWSIKREFEANHEEMVLSDYWHNKPLRGVTNVDVCLEDILELHASLPNVILVDFPIFTCTHLIPCNGSSQIL